MAYHARIVLSSPWEPISRNSLCGNPFLASSVATVTPQSGASVIWARARTSSRLHSPPRPSKDSRRGAAPAARELDRLWYRIQERRTLLRLLPVLITLLALASLAVWAACGSSGPADLFQNPSFEDGAEPWISLSTEAWGARFTLADGVAHSGEHSALLEMRAAQEAGPKVFGVVQEVQPKKFPELISGYYRVAEWTRGTDIQYLQFVVIAIGAKNMPGNFPNHQLRYILAGIDHPPFDVSNAKFIFVGTEEPTPDGWVYFERNVRQDFIDQWGAAPEGFSTIRVLFEVRYDDKEAGVTTPAADVFYDDLYLGPAKDNPNTP